MSVLFFTIKLNLRLSSKASEIGKKVGPGLPNIYGAFAYVTLTHDSIDFATDAFNFNNYEPRNRRWMDIMNMPSAIVNFDASRSNSIYGNSTEVLPNSVNTAYAIYLGSVS